MIWPGSKQLRWRDLFKRLAAEWKEDSISTTAAALTYYGVLALFPFLLFLVALAGLVLDPSATANLVQQLGRVAPGQVTQIVGDRLHAITNNPSGGLLTVGIVGALWSASGAVTALMQALDRSYDVRETRPFWKTRPLALAVTIGGGVLTIVAALVMFFVPVVGHYVPGPVGTAIAWLRFPVAGFVVMTAWALMYWALPNVQPRRFQIVSPGSIVGVIAWLLASWGFSQYVAHSRSYDATYGAVGGMIVLLVWMYLSSIVVLLGAEINKILTPAEKLKFESEAGEGRTATKARSPVAKPRAPREPEPSGA
jgi:membrane protein